MKISPVTVSVALLMLAACTPSFSPQQQAFLQELANRPVTCANGADCDKKWNRAIEWVSKHSQTGMKDISDNLILTNNVTDGSQPPNRYPEFTVVRYIKENTRVMSFDSYCDHGFACNPTGLQLKAGFVTFVMGPPPGVAVHADGEGATKILPAAHQ